MNVKAVITVFALVVILGTLIAVTVKVPVSNVTENETINITEPIEGFCNEIEFNAWLAAMGVKVYPSIEDGSLIYPDSFDWSEQLPVEQINLIAQYACEHPSGTPTALYTSETEWHTVGAIQRYVCSVVQKDGGILGAWGWRADADGHLYPDGPRTDLGGGRMKFRFAFGFVETGLCFPTTYPGAKCPGLWYYQPHDKYETEGDTVKIQCPDNPEIWYSYTWGEYPYTLVIPELVFRNIMCGNGDCQSFETPESCAEDCV